MVLRMSTQVVLLAIASQIGMAQTTQSLGPPRTANAAEQTTPKSVVLAFRDAVSRRDWQTAEMCLASELREMLRDSLRDRTFFDQYVTDGFRVKTLALLPAHLATEEGLADLERFEQVPGIHSPGPPSSARYSAIIAQGGGACPWVAFCWLVKEKEGWKLTLDPDRIKGKQDFLDWYEMAIPKKSQGRAKQLEGGSGSQPAPRPR